MPPQKSLPRLSKSRFMAGLQCHKRLYLECYRRDLMDPVTAGQQLLFDTGHEVGARAREAFPGGLLVEADHFHHDDAVRITRDALVEPAIPALFEAGFIHADVKVRVDVLSRNESGWDLTEVKATTSVKEEHLWDAALQLLVVEGAGVPVESVSLMHLDSGYIYDGRYLDLERLFVRRDVTGEARALRDPVLAALDGMREMLRGAGPPALGAGRHCADPYVCPFATHCRAEAPAFPVFELPRIGRDTVVGLERAGITEIAQIPPVCPELTPLQQRVRACVITGETYCDPRAGRALAEVDYPLHFLDFEALAPAIPVFAGTRPYHRLPFQFSLDVVGADGSRWHREYLHGGPGDPRRPLAEALLSAVEERGTIFMYHHFERDTINRLASDLPDLADLLHALVPRLFDLCALMRDCVYHRDFRGSFSMKRVLPTLIPALAYDDLEIGEGQEASAVYMRLMSGELPTAEAEAAREALRRYCARDTEAMVGLVEWLGSRT